MSQVKEGKLVLAFCWAHVRRDFVRVGKGYPELSGWAVQWLDRIRTLYRLNRERLAQQPGSAQSGAADAKLREHVQSLVVHRELELADDKLREPCRKALVSLSNHWSGLTLFVDDPRIPLDNNYAERMMRGPAVGRKNYYGSGAEWSGRLAMMMFSILATLKLWNINPQAWLSWYFSECASSGGTPASHPESFLPWNLSEDRLAELRNGIQTPVIDDTS
jgi:transposase